MRKDTDMSRLKYLIGSLRETAEELKRSGGMIPAVERNTSRLLASVRMLEINCCDLENVDQDNTGNGDRENAPPIVAKTDSLVSVEQLPGVKVKPMAHGGSTHLVEFKIQPGTLLAEHSHPHEQTGYLVSGSITLTINGIPHKLEPGDSWCIPGNVSHSAEIHQESLVIEVFSPPREDFVQKPGH